MLEMLEEFFEDVPFERRKMFGQYALFLNGHMFAGVFQDDIFVRYPPEFQDTLKERFDEIEHFAPMKGRAMKEYLILPESVYDDAETMDSIIVDCIAYVEQLPPK